MRLYYVTLEHLRAEEQMMLFPRKVFFRETKNASKKANAVGQKACDAPLGASVNIICTKKEWLLS